MKNRQQVKYVVSYISSQLHWQLHFYQCLCETHQKDEVESSQNPPGIYCMIIDGNKCDLIDVVIGRKKINNSDTNKDTWEQLVRSRIPFLLLEIGGVRTIVAI